MDLITNQGTIKISKADLAKVRDFSTRKINLYYNKHDDKMYAQVPKQDEISGHVSNYTVARIILDLLDQPSKVVVFKDRNPLNLMRSNMQVIDGENRNVTRKANRNSTSLYKGVTPSGNKWKAQKRIDGKLTHLGTFDTPELAAKAFNAAAKKTTGRLASLNKINTP